MSESVFDSSNNSVDQISLPLSQMICVECDTTSITEPFSAVEYSRTKKEITFGKKRHFEIVVDVIHVARKYDPITATYSVNAVFRIHCPSCKQDRLETKQLAELPVTLLKDLGTCPTCGEDSSIHIVSSDMIQLSENVDEIRLQANIYCAECNSESFIYKQIKTYLHRYLQSSPDGRVSSYYAPPIRLENSDFEVNTLEMNTTLVSCQG